MFWVQSIGSYSYGISLTMTEHYFEMSKVDAERALAIYKTFSKQTDEVVAFLGVARTYENATRLEIPKLKHAPTSLTSSLEEYLTDTDFEINRRQYLAQQEAKKAGKPKSLTKDPSERLGKLNLNNDSLSSSKPLQEAKPAQVSAAKSEPKGPAPDLIDFFESIEQNQQPMNAQPQTQIPNLQAVPQYQFQQQPFQNMSVPGPQQPNGTLDSTNPFASMVNQQQQQNPPQPNFTGFNPQQQTQAFNANQQVTGMPQDQTAFFSQQSFLNGPSQPQSAFTANQPQQTLFQAQPQQMPNNAQLQQFNTGQQMQPLTNPQPQQSTNPFRQSMMPQSGQSTSPFSTTSSLSSPQDGGRQTTNPFARSMASQPPSQAQSSPFTSPPPSSTSLFSPQSMQSTPVTKSIQPARTGTNPFARSAPSSTFQTPTTSPLVAQTTGTNPFRQSAFMNQQTGQGWQAGQGSMGGLEKLETIPVFPRPTGQPQPQPQQPWS